MENVRKNKKILILGDARHGKDTIAEMICRHTDLKFASSSETALDIFLRDVLEKKYGLVYETREEAYLDRVNHRDKWYNEICEYNSTSRIRLAKDIMKIADIYVGMRSHLEVEACIRENVFDHIIGVVNYRKPKEDSKSNSIDINAYCDYIICNYGDLAQLEAKVINLLPILQ